MATNIISQEELKSLLHYDPETGVFTWKVNRGGTAKEGIVAGSKNSWGYVQIWINNKSYKAHRLVWLYVYGFLPKHQLDHISGVKYDNRLCNLRESSNAENMQNKNRQENNTSGYIGVHYHIRYKKWMAAISLLGKRKHLGYFTTPELAYEAYLKAKAELHEFQPTPR